MELARGGRAARSSKGSILAAIASSASFILSISAKIFCVFRVQFEGSTWLCVKKHFIIEWRNDPTSQSAVQCAITHQENQC